MDKTTLDILQIIYHETADKKAMTMSALVVQTGRSGYELRNHIEDLKDKGYIVEHKEGFFISDSGISFGSRRWI